MTTVNIPTINISPTTLNGYLTSIMVVCGAVAATDGVPVKIRGAATVIGAIATGIRIRVGHIQQDAGSTAAIIPGVATVQQVPSHETPDSPVAIPISEVAATPVVAPFPKSTIKP